VHAQRPVHELTELKGKRLGQEPVGDNDDAARAGKHRHVADESIDLAQGGARLVFRHVERFGGFILRFLQGHFPAVILACKACGVGVVRGHIERLAVMLVVNQIGFIGGDVNATLCPGCNGAGPEGKEGLMDLLEVGRKVQLLLTGRGKHSHPISWLNGAGKVMVRGIPRALETFDRGVHVVKVQPQDSKWRGHRFAGGFPRRWDCLRAFRKVGGRVGRRLL